MATFIKYALKCVTDMVLYNICGRIFDPRLIGTDSRRMQGNKYVIHIMYKFVLITYMIQRCIAYLFQSGGRGPEEQILRFQFGHKE